MEKKEKEIGKIVGGINSGFDGNHTCTVDDEQGFCGCFV